MHIFTAHCIINRRYRLVFIVWKKFSTLTLSIFIWEGDCCCGGDNKHGSMKAWISIRFLLFLVFFPCEPTRPHEMARLKQKMQMYKQQHLMEKSSIYSAVIMVEYFDGQNRPNNSFMPSLSLLLTCLFASKNHYFSDFRQASFKASNVKDGQDVHVKFINDTGKKIRTNKGCLMSLI